MNKTELLKYGVDYSEGLRRFVGHDDIFRGYLLEFLSESGFRRLEDDIKACRYSEAFKEAHALKGLTGNLSLNGLHSELVALVELLRENASGERIRAQYNIVAFRHVETADALRAYLDEA
ncbi:MAG: hypothetical protein PHI27_08950 [Eubacteriales bacterium]|nr:hypothetical protein [Eubacteriales bacterium]MDD3882367.1 hypothetical protein [Eubacteriales bacterium]MDD4512412.1 hypothetical protein [Eubacteriales bacterium]